MTDRGRGALRQTRQSLTIGPSSFDWDGRRLVIHLEERGALPALGHVRGKVILTPDAVTSVDLPLSGDEAHVWRPFAPVAKIEVDLDAPGWQWTGHGYFDANFGERPLEMDFVSWSWSRFPTLAGAACFYQAQRRDGSLLSTAIGFDRKGEAKTLAQPDRARLARSLWALGRSTPCDAGHVPTVVRTMLDAPFYARSVVRTQLDGAETTGVHETLDLTRFGLPLLKPMLALRVPRRAAWSFS